MSEPGRLHFVTTARNRGPLEWYLADLGRPLATLFVAHTYEALLAAPGVATLPRGTWIFADVELLTAADRARAVAFHDALEDRGDATLNHPTRSLSRVPLLQRLHADGINDFAVHTLDRDGTPVGCPIRYPVFVREADDHHGSVSPLLHDRIALWRWLDHARATGTLPRQPLVVEFCDTSDRRGVFAKYGAFVVGDAIVPRHLFFSRDWVVKDWRLVGPRELAAERAYVADNPHAAALSDIARRAGIDYGRIDYGLRDGRVQVFEINTNPTITGRTPSPHLRRRLVERARAELRRRLPALAPDKPRAPVNERFAAALATRWLELSGASSPRAALISTRPLSAAPSPSR